MNKNQTLGYEQAPLVADTLAAPVEQLLANAPLASTQAAPAVETTHAPPPNSGAAMATATRTSSGRTVVLPRKTTTSAGEVSLEWTTDSQPRFESIKPLGEGGMGEVVLVKDQDIQRKVAVKKLKSDAKTPANLLRFAEEVQVVGALEHPGIIPVYDVGIDELGQHYLVMKYVNGETLEHIIDKLREHSPAHEKRFTFEHRTEIFLKILEAIRYAHSHGIIHRDIKPANIMVGPYGEVTVMDWGIAKRVGSQDTPSTAPNETIRHKELANTERERLLRTQQGSLLGTPLYMSPEQASGKTAELDPRSDVFSLCMMFYEFLTLKHPLQDKQTLEEVIFHLQTQEWNHTDLKLKAFQQGVPAELCHFVVRGLTKNPAQRFQSVEEMESYIHTLNAGIIPVQCPLTATKRLNGEVMAIVDKHPFIAILAITAFALLALVGGVMGVLRLLH